MRWSQKLIFGQVGVLMSTSFPEKMSIKLLLRLKIERFEISDLKKKSFLFWDPDNTRRSAFKHEILKTPYKHFLIQIELSKILDSLSLKKHWYEYVLVFGKDLEYKSYS